MRLTLGSVQLSMLPQVIGACANDLPTIAAYVNRAQERLINCGGETGWIGGWQHVAFPISVCYPYFTLPPEWSRVINLDICRTPLRIQNEFYEYLEAGPGLQGCPLPTSGNEWQQLSKTPGWGNWKRGNCGALQGFERGMNFPLFRDIAPINQKVKIYTTDPRDAGKRVLVGPAWDQNGNPIYTQDGNNQVNGFYLLLGTSPVTSPMEVSRIDGIQKDPTYGQVIFKQLDVTTAVEVTLSKFAPWETIPAYRRYYINSVPYTPTCPQSPCVEAVNGGTIPVVPREVTVNALVKLQYTPALLATDFLIIGCLPALIEEVKCIRYMDQDAQNAPQMAEVAHRRAIKMLQDEMRTFIGELNPAVNFAPFGTARITRPLAAIRFG
jgi:hypothetical protein